MFKAKKTVTNRGFASTFNTLISSLFLLSLVGSCKFEQNKSIAASPTQDQNKTAKKEIVKPPIIKKLTIIKSFDRSEGIFTQGITLENGVVYESSGGYGKSFIHSYNFPIIKQLQKKPLDNSLFAEGSTIIGDTLFVLTWREKRCLLFNKNSFEKIGEFKYNTEGWGLTSDSKHLYLSDGSDNIYKIDPKDFKFIGKLKVRTNKGPVDYLNELEWIDGYLYANIFTQNYIAKIDPSTGIVLEVYITDNIYDNSKGDPSEDVLNGIMYDKKSNKAYITGKSWNKIFEVKF